MLAAEIRCYNKPLLPFGVGKSVQRECVPGPLEHLVRSLPRALCEKPGVHVLGRPVVSAPIWWGNRNNLLPVVDCGEASLMKCGGALLVRSVCGSSPGIAVAAMAAVGVGWG